MTPSLRPHTIKNGRLHVAASRLCFNRGALDRVSEEYIVGLQSRLICLMFLIST